MASWPAFKAGSPSLVPVSVAGASPVKAITFDLVGDGRPGIYFLVRDARGVINYPLTFQRAGRFEVTVTATDIQGCEGSLSTRTWITVTN